MSHTEKYTGTGVCISDSQEPDLFETGGIPAAGCGKSHWSIAWSDLMMTMFILFAVMYIYQQTQNGVKLDDRPQKPRFSDGISVYRNDLIVNDAIREAFPEIYAVTRKNMPETARMDLIEENAVRLTLTNDLLFETGMAELKKEARSVLAGLADALKKNDYFINISGHTDNRPIHTENFPTNWELSAFRACSVARFLNENFAIPSDRFFITGHADHKPVKPNTTPENRASNRRVEIIITRTEP